MDAMHFFHFSWTFSEIFFVELVLSSSGRHINAVPSGKRAISIFISI